MRDADVDADDDDALTSPSLSSCAAALPQLLIEEGERRREDGGGEDGALISPAPSLCEAMRRGSGGEGQGRLGLGGREERKAERVRGGGGEVLNEGGEEEGRRGGETGES
eukprot:732521-Rhodomonas_salina.1